MAFPTDPTAAYFPWFTVIFPPPPVGQGAGFTPPFPPPSIPPPVGPLVGPVVRYGALGETSWPVGGDVEPPPEPNGPETRNDTPRRRRRE